MWRLQGNNEFRFRISDGAPTEWATLVAVQNLAVPAFVDRSLARALLECGLTADTAGLVLQV